LEDGSGEEMTAIKGQQFPEKKGRQVFFSRKIGVTPSVAAPGDTNLSDASESSDFMALYKSVFNI